MKLFVLISILFTLSITGLMAQKTDSDTKKSDPDNVIITVSLKKIPNQPLREKTNTLERKRVTTSYDLSKSEKLIQKDLELAFLTLNSARFTSRWEDSLFD